MLRLRMPLPFADQAVVHDDKLVGYLLNVDHPRGGGKARFFLSLGFRPDKPDALRDALVDLARMADAVPVPHEYVVDGEVRTPSGRDIRFRTVWMLDGDRPPPRLVTAYPLHRTVR